MRRSARRRRARPLAGEARRGSRARRQPRGAPALRRGAGRGRDAARRPRPPFAGRSELPGGGRPARARGHRVRRQGAGLSRPAARDRRPPKLRVTIEKFLAAEPVVEQAWATEREAVLGAVTRERRIELTPVEPSLLPWAIARAVGLGPREHRPREPLA